MYKRQAEELAGGGVFLDTVSVGATINIMLAAVKAKGKTVIDNAAREPHIVDVANFLNVMGADIRGAGTDVIRINGRPMLPGGREYTVIPDQIEAGTYMLLAPLTRGDITVDGVIPKHMEPLTAKLQEMDVTCLLYTSANERTESQAILSSLNVGIVAYGSDNRLIASNPVAELYFGVIPDSLDSFLDRFGADNGMRAAYYLESDDVSGELDIDGYTLRLVCQQHPLRIDGERFGGHIITAQDVTQFRRQEEQRKVFVANVSHELKTPLTTIKSYSETLLDWGIDEKSRDDIKSDVTRIYDDSIRMERLIADLLLLSTIDSSRLHVQMVLFNLSECARQICERFRDQASAKSIALDFSVLSLQSTVLADRSSVERILTNLIVNCLLYTSRCV